MFINARQRTLGHLLTRIVRDSCTHPFDKSWSLVWLKEYPTGCRQVMLRVIAKPRTVRWAMNMELYWPYTTIISSDQKKAGNDNSTIMVTKLGMPSASPCNKFKLTSANKKIAVCLLINKPAWLLRRKKAQPHLLLRIDFKIPIFRILLQPHIPHSKVS